MLLLRASPAPAPAVAIPISSFSAASVPSYTSRIPIPSSFSTVPRCSVGNLSPVQFEPLRGDAGADPAFFQAGAATADGDEQYQPQEHGGGEDQDEEEEKKGGINVPRQRYIAVPKAALLDAALSLFPSQPAAAEDFRRFARCLDAVLHAEHKETLEQMRAYYMLRDDDQEQEEKGPAQASGGNQASSSVNGRGSGLFGMSQDGGDDDDDRMSFLSRSLDWKTLLGLSPDPAPVSPTRVAFATHFQRAFMNLLRNAQFEELSAQDLLLTYSLNSDYLLTLPVYVDWKKAAESNAIIFRRGYSTESQKGLLLVEKLDYLQSKLLQNIFFSLSKPLGKLGKWTNEALKKSTGSPGFQIWIDKLKLWLKEQTYAENSLLLIENYSRGKLTPDQLPDADLPIWIAAQRAVSRYEGFLSPVGPRGRLLRRVLTWTGLIPSLPEATLKSDTETKQSEGYVRPNFLPRITLANIWEPASRESCDNNVWEIVKASFGILFAQSTLQEPAFEELIILYSDDSAQSNEKESSEMQMLPPQLKIYQKIPIPDLPVVFPHKKLSFRILDTVRLDIATVIGLLAYVVNYKFESLASSPSAFLLDLAAFTALAILVFRVTLGYKQTRDRYQLLVNKTLYEKTLASGFGSVYFLLDASEQQQYKEALLAYAMLLSRNKYQVSSRTSVRDMCEQFMYEKFNAKIEMPIDKAMETLLRLGLVVELSTNGSSSSVIALPCPDAYEILKGRWDSLLEHKT
ncbi:hypothetical protein CFC21_055746 [Triticum aestivum]|uniref:Uncharacterized protein n=2 Tax=Triticum aestivum TaxID=4565 RepID=A0A3B6I3R5_WHEAT|nr:uncharacterized protein LOC123088592 [Triticum aestivum]KAF7046743.1 hypothetical protein CFC21_055746 [Triticum aestivum]